MANAEIREVGLRDGLQLVKNQLPTQHKIDWFTAAAAAGIREIEVTSFVPPAVVPQFSDAPVVARSAVSNGGFLASALVPNLKGAELAFAAGLPRINYVVSVSETHNQANVRRTTAESIADFIRIAGLREETAGPRRLIGAGLATSFGCSLEGRVCEKRVIELAVALAEAGADEIALADTVGYADPRQVRRLVSAVLAAVSPLPVACHFHDTRGLGLANVAAAVDVGIVAFDTALGGLGGCPFAPGATGNVNTEDAVFLLERLGLHTGVDLDALLALRGKVEGWMPDERFSGAIARAGLPKSDRPH